jgi:hypothetical protein
MLHQCTEEGAWIKPHLRAYIAFFGGIKKSGFLRLKSVEKWRDRRKRE